MMLLFVNTSKREHEIKKKAPPDFSGRVLEQIMKKTYCLLSWLIFFYMSTYLANMLCNCFVVEFFFVVDGLVASVYAEIYCMVW